MLGAEMHLTQDILSGEGVADKTREIATVSADILMPVPLVAEIATALVQVEEGRNGTVPGIADKGEHKGTLRIFFYDLTCVAVKRILQKMSDGVYPRITDRTDNGQAGGLGDMYEKDVFFSGNSASSFFLSKRIRKIFEKYHKYSEKPGDRWKSSVFMSFTPCC